MSDDEKQTGPVCSQQAQSEYPVSRLAPSFTLVDAAAEISRATDTVGTHTEARLLDILEQIRRLQQDAKTVLEEARQSVEVHSAACRFKKKIGSLYHLYRKDDSTTYMAMLSPDDWGGSPPHTFVGTYRLEADQSWTPLETIEARDARRSQLSGLKAALLPANTANSDTQ